MDWADKRPSTFSGAGSDKRSLDRSYCRHDDADRKNTQAVQKKHPTLITDLDDVIPPLPLLN